MTLFSPGLRLNSKLYFHLKTTNVLGATLDIRGMKSTKNQRKITRHSVFIVRIFPILLKCHSCYDKTGFSDGETVKIHPSAAVQLNSPGKILPQIPLIKNPGMYYVVQSMFKVISSMYHVVPSMSHVVTKLSHVVPNISLVALIMSHVVPSMSYKVPSMSHVVPSMSHGVPSMSHVVLITSHVVKSWSHVVPSLSYVVPSKSSQ